MRSNVKNIILAISGVVAILFVGSVFAYDKTCFDPEVQVLKQLKAKGTSDAAELAKLKALPALEAAEAKRCAFLKSLTPSDKARIVEEKIRGHEEHLKEVERWREQGLLNPVAPQPSPFQGLMDAKDVPFPFHDISPVNFKPISFWGGKVNGKEISIFSGFDPKNPLSGIVLIENDGSYQTLSKTGPLEIISEDNGVLTLKSIVDEYEVYHIDSDTRENIKTPGGAIYLFDIKTRTFQ